MNYNEIERLQQLAGILTEVKINKPSDNLVDLFIKNKYKPIKIEDIKGVNGQFITYELEDGTIIQYYPNHNKVVGGSSPKNSRIVSTIQKYIDSLK